MNSSPENGQDMWSKYRVLFDQNVSSQRKPWGWHRHAYLGFIAILPAAGVVIWGENKRAEERKQNEFILTKLAENGINKEEFLKLDSVSRRQIVSRILGTNTVKSTAPSQPPLPAASSSSQSDSTMASDIYSKIQSFLKPASPLSNIPSSTPSSSLPSEPIPITPSSSAPLTKPEALSFVESTISEAELLSIIRKLEDRIKVLEETKSVLPRLHEAPIPIALNSNSSQPSLLPKDEAASGSMSSDAITAHFAASSAVRSPESRTKDSQGWKSWATGGVKAIWNSGRRWIGGKPSSTVEAPSVDISNNNKS